jgi:adenine-specific DNA-methyltransferase
MTLFPNFAANLQALKSRFGNEIQEEADALEASDYTAFARVVEGWRHVGNDKASAKEARRLARKPTTFPYRLCTLTFSHSYFGLRQAAELDSLRWAVDRCRLNGQITPSQFTRCLVGIMQVASRIASAPGHFAEFLNVHNDLTYQRVSRLRKRSVWEQFQIELQRIEPYGTSGWRSMNRVFCREAGALAKGLQRFKRRPSVVYADPPYSKAQYSRYYHVLETITLYDYPAATGTGRYRKDRFQTPFSKLGTVAAAFDHLVSNVSASGSSFVLSYPTNGLLFLAGSDPVSIMSKAYKSVRLAAAFSKRHSTLGAAHGASKRDVQEMIFVARRAR